MIDRNERVGSMVEKGDLEVVEVLGGDDRRGISIIPHRRERQSHTSQLFGVAKVERTGFEQDVSRCEWRDNI